MLKASTIVCAFDVSAASKESLPLAAKLAGDMGARLVLVHPVHFHNWYIYSLVIYNPQRAAAESAGRVERFVREIMNRTPAVKWEVKVEAGRPEAVIAAVAEETGADLVVSARRRGRLEVLKSSPRVEPTAEVPKTPEPDWAFSPAAGAGAARQTQVASY